MLTSATSLSTSGNLNLPPTAKSLQGRRLNRNPVRLGSFFCTSFARHSNFSSTFLFCDVARTATTVTLISSPAPQAGARTIRNAVAKKATRKLRVDFMANTQFRRVNEIIRGQYVRFYFIDDLFAYRIFGLLPSHPRYYDVCRRGCSVHPGLRH